MTRVTPPAPFTFLKARCDTTLHHHSTVWEKTLVLATDGGADATSFSYMKAPSYELQLWWPSFSGHLLQCIFVR
jgi:hypothetical protein